MILSSVITEVRRILQDETTTYRYSDVFLLGFCNQALKRIQLLRPDLFAYDGTVTCTQGEVLQSAPSDSLRIIEVFSIVGGNSLAEVDRASLDQASPGWINDTEAAAVNWMRHVRSPNKFFIYPQAPAAQVLNIEYSQVPPDYAEDAVVELLADAYFPVVVDAVIFLAESIDNEHVTSGRAKLYQDSFLQMLGITSVSNLITDTENAGQPIQSTDMEVV